VVCAALFCTARGFAEEPDTAHAKQLFREGEAAFSAGRYKEAVGKFDLAFAESPRPLLLWNIAQAYRKQFDVDHDAKNLKAAHASLQQYIEMGAMGDDRQHAEAIDADVMAQLAVIEAPKAAEPHAAPPMDTSPPIPDEGRHGSRVPGIAVGAAGLVILGGGLAFGLLAQSAASTVHGDGSPTNPVPWATAADDDARGHLMATLSYACFAVGAVAVVAGVVLAILRPGAKSRASAFLTPGPGGTQVVGSW
jgi:hypothetical protein